ERATFKTSDLGSTPSMAETLGRKLRAIASMAPRSTFLLPDFRTGARSAIFSLLPLPGIQAMLPPSAKETRPWRLSTEARHSTGAERWKLDQAVCVVAAIELCTLSSGSICSEACRRSLRKARLERVSWPCLATWAWALPATNVASARRQRSPYDSL